MTVKTLIELLQKCNEKTEVCIHDRELVDIEKVTYDIRNEVVELRTVDDC